MNLNEIDAIRDEILTTPGNVTYNLQGDKSEIKNNICAKRY